MPALRGGIEGGCRMEKVVVGEGWNQVGIKIKVKLKLKCPQT